MNVMHPDGRTKIFMHDGTGFIADMEVTGPGWVTFGYIGGEQKLLIDVDEWPAFFAMVNEIDAARRMTPNVMYTSKLTCKTAPYPS